MVQAFVYHGPAFSELRTLYNRWTWQELRWGLEHTIVNESDLRSYASEQLNESNPLFDLLLDLVTEDKYSDQITRKVDNLCNAEVPESNGQIEFVWRNVILIWIIQQQYDDAKLQNEIELLFATFSHPADMASLIRWMPPSPGEVCSLPWNIRVQLKKYIDNCSFFQS